MFGRDEYFSKLVHSDDTTKYKIVRRGQFAYATIHLDEGSIDFLKDESAGLISPMYTVFEITSQFVDIDFAFRSLKRLALSGRFDPFGNGGVNRRKSISFSDLKAFKFALPPLAEQRAIAAVLGELDTTIKKGEEVIRALESAKVMLVEASLEELHGQFGGTRNASLA